MRLLRVGVVSDAPIISKVVRLHWDNWTHSHDLGGSPASPETVSSDWISNSIVFLDVGLLPVYFYVYICKSDKLQNKKKYTQKEIYFWEREKPSNNGRDRTDLVNVMGFKNSIKLLSNFHNSHVPGHRENHVLPSVSSYIWHLVRCHFSTKEPSSISDQVKSNRWLTLFPKKLSNFCLWYSIHNWVAMYQKVELRRYLKVCVFVPYKTCAVFWHFYRSFC